MIVAVAYKFATNEMMPKVAYLTLLDSYILSSSLVLVLVVLQNGIASGTSSPREGEGLWPTFDRDSQYGLLLAWFALQARFFFLYRTIHRKRKIATDPDLLIKSKAVIHAREQLIKFNDIASSFEMLNLEVPENVNHCGVWRRLVSSLCRVSCTVHSSPTLPCQATALVFGFEPMLVGAVGFPDSPLWAATKVSARS